MTRSTKTLADVIGLPDEVDKRRIQRYLLKYEKAHPGEIQFHRDMARARLTEENKKFAIIDKASQRRYLFELPEEIGIWMGQAFPLMFKDKKHTAWFCKNFKELMIPEEY